MKSRRYKSGIILEFLQKTLETGRRKIILIFLEDCKSSARDIEKVMKWMRHKFGRNFFFFTPNITAKITEHLNDLGDLHEGEAVIFKDKARWDIKSVLAKFTDMSLFIDEMVNIRDIKRSYSCFSRYLLLYFE